METSRWFLAVTHPVSGKRTTLYADSELLLERQVLAWHIALDDEVTSELTPSRPRRRV